ncbi:MAG TPA: phosphoribosyltransferase [Alphaproteobacteria bacterium]|nr:phosphoribosyltransferase [Alphaproteobacteria bacterium]
MAMDAGRELPFSDRTEAGRLLAGTLMRLRPARPLVLALPPGGVPVALPIAAALAADFDLLLVRPLGRPGRAGSAVGAVVEGDPPRRTVNRNMQWALGLAETDLADDERRQIDEMRRLRLALMGGRPPLPAAGRPVVLVDDGTAPGLVLSAALSALGRMGAAELVLATPLLSPTALADLRRVADEVACLAACAPGERRGLGYRDPAPDEAGLAALLRAAPGIRPEPR